MADPLGNSHHHQLHDARSGFPKNRRRLRGPPLHLEPPERGEWAAQIPIHRPWSLPPVPRQCPATLMTGQFGPCGDRKMCTGLHQAGAAPLTPPNLHKALRRASPGVSRVCLRILPRKATQKCLRLRTAFRSDLAKYVLHTSTSICISHSFIPLLLLLLLLLPVLVAWKLFLLFPRNHLAALRLLFTGFVGPAPAHGCCQRAVPWVH